MLKFTIRTLPPFYAVVECLLELNKKSFNQYGFKFLKILTKINFTWIQNFCCTKKLIHFFYFVFSCAWVWIGNLARKVYAEKSIGDILSVRVLDILNLEYSVVFSF